MTYYEISKTDGGVQYYKQVDKFPNGFTSWQETHFEIARFITSYDEDNGGTIGLVAIMQGIGGLYELAEDWTDEFEQLNKDRDWDGEFYDVINEFCNLKNKPNESND